MYNPNEDEFNEFWDQFNQETDSNLKLLLDWSLDSFEFSGKDIDMNACEPKFKKKLTASVYIKKKGNELF